LLGYFVSTVGLDEEIVKAYIRNQENNDENLEQLKFGQQFPQTRFRLAHFQLIKNDFIVDEQSQTAAISAVGFNGW